LGYDPDFNKTVENSAFGVLVLIAFGLLLVVSGGIVYLTVAEWRDRRRRDRDAKERPLARNRSQR
jgi:uncharacterized membrane protein (DUF373 family)